MDRKSWGRCAFGNNVGILVRFEEGDVEYREESRHAGRQLELVGVVSNIIFDRERA